MATAVEFTAEELAELRTVDGFRQRGVEMTRLETFTDAAFAFAVTLLVVGGGDSVPANFDEMTQALMQIPAFVASFANILWFWYAHHVWSRRFGLDDLGAILLSLGLVLVVLIYIYPLKAIYSGAIEFFSNGFFQSYFHIGSLHDLRILFVVFGTAYFVLSGMITLLYRHAIRRAQQLALNELELFESRQAALFWLVNACVGMFSVLLAISLPPNLIVIAGIWYCSLGIIAPWHETRKEKLRQNLPT